MDEATTLNRLAEIQSQLLDFDCPPQETCVINGEARYVTWNLSDLRGDTVEILQITDIQFGHKQCQEDKLHEYLAWVLSKPNRYIVLGGDLVDAGHKSSKGSPFEQIGDPQEEVWRFCQIIAPLRHRILGYVGGNHERRSLDMFGDLGKAIATIIKVPYSPGNQLIDVTFGEHKPFKISMHHGTGAAQTIGGIAVNLEKFIRKGDSQWYLLGHLHTPLTILTSREVRSGNGGTQLIKVVGSRGSTFLGYYGTYAEVILNTNPQLIAMPLARLERNGHWAVELR